MDFGVILQSGINEVIYYLSAHVIFCLVPAFFIAGGIAAMLSQDVVLRYFGPNAPKHVSYGVASVSGCILAVCSCTVLPIFAGIYKKGAGLGPAIAFLFSGPAINVLAISLTASQMGFEIGLARAVSAVLLAVAIGVLMEVVFKEKPNDVLGLQSSSEMFDNGKEYNSACGCTCQTSDYRMFDNAKEYNRPILHTLAFLEYCLLY